MILSDFALIASNTARTKAYIQIMAGRGLFPSACIVYAEDMDVLYRESRDYTGSMDMGDYFNRDIPLLTLMDHFSMKYIVVKDKDINSDSMIECIRGLPQTYFIYSGYGGAILKSTLFQLGKNFLHVHAGILPEYRGSTTAYYSILKEGCLGATAIFLNEKIDEGRMICRKRFALPEETVDIDYIYEPYIRAQVLLMALEYYVKHGRFDVQGQSDENAETYYIIHPVLKHLALNYVREGFHEDCVVHTESRDSRKL